MTRPRFVPVSNDDDSYALTREHIINHREMADLIDAAGTGGTGVAVPANTIVGSLDGANVAALTGAQARTILGSDAFSDIDFRTVAEQAATFGSVTTGSQSLVDGAYATVIFTGVDFPASRTVTDGHTTNSSTTITSATANFTAADVGAGIFGTNIDTPNFPVSIASVTNATTAELSDSATGSTAAGTFTIDPRFSLATGTDSWMNFFQPGLYEITVEGKITDNVIGDIVYDITYADWAGNSIRRFRNSLPAAFLHAQSFGFGLIEHQFVTLIPPDLCPGYVALRVYQNSGSTLSLSDVFLTMYPLLEG